MPASGMHDHVRRLVDDGEVVVFIEDVERNVLGNRAFSRRLDHAERDDVAGSEPKRRLAVPPVDVDALGRLNRLAEQHAAILRKLRGEKLVETPSGLRVGHDAFGDLADLLLGREPRGAVINGLKLVERFDVVKVVFVVGKFRRHIVSSFALLA